MRLKTLVLSVLAVLGPAAAAEAATFKPFTDAAFMVAEQGGKNIVVEVYAPWCPICARQQPILQSIEASPAYANVTVFRVDFDTQKDVLRELRVQMQSTLIGFHGNTETARLAGAVSRPAIEALFASTRKS